MKLSLVIAVLILKNFNGISCSKSEYKSIRINDKILIRSNILFGLLKLSFNETLNMACKDDLELIYKSIKERKIWALRGKI